MTTRVHDSRVIERNAERQRTVPFRISMPVQVRPGVEGLLTPGFFTWGFPVCHSKIEIGAMHFMIQLHAMTYIFPLI